MATSLLHRALIPRFRLTLRGRTATVFSRASDLLEAKSGESKKEKLPAGGVWRTINGVPVYIKDGKALTGPLKGKSLSKQLHQTKTSTVQFEELVEFSTSPKGGYARLLESRNNDPRYSKPSPDDKPWKEGVRHGEQAVVSTKKAAAVHVGDRMKAKLGGKDIDADTIDAFLQMATGKPREKLPYLPSNKHLLAMACNDAWVGTSVSAPLSYAMQTVAAKVFNVGSEGLANRGDFVKTFGKEDGAAYKFFTTGKGRDIITAFLESTYEHTQERLRQAGITEVPLVRGARLSSEDIKLLGRSFSGVEFDLQPLSSFSARPWADEAFGADRYYGVALTTKIPASRVFSTAVTGMGSLEEEEFVILGGPTVCDGQPHSKSY